MNNATTKTVKIDLFPSPRGVDRFLYLESAKNYGATAERFRPLSRQIGSYTGVIGFVTSMGTAVSVLSRGR